MGELDAALTESGVGKPVELPYGCSECDERFATPTDKASHVRKTGHGKKPKSDRKPKDAAPRTSPAARRTSFDKLAEGLTKGVVQIGMGVSLFDPTCGRAIAAGAPAFADGWVAVARENPRVKKALESLLTGSAWGQALAGTAGIALPILAHHNLLPKIAIATAAPAASNGHDPDVETIEEP